MTNDDGPPHSKDSPLILAFYIHLTTILSENVKVVLPASQKSWIGKAFHIKETTSGQYFYPKLDGSGELTSLSRPVKEGEIVNIFTVINSVSYAQP